MHKSFTAALAVNDAAVELNPFVEEFLVRTVVGGVSCLRGAEKVEDLELFLKGGDVKLVVNGEELPLTPFPRDIIKGTVSGLVSSLKGVGRIDSVKIGITIR